MQLYMTLGSPGQTKNEFDIFLNNFQLILEHYASKKNFYL